MLCGAADEQVDPQDSLDMYTALQRQGIQSELHLLAQTAHSDGELKALFTFSPSLPAGCGSRTSVSLSFVCVFVQPARVTSCFMPL